MVRFSQPTAKGLLFILSWLRRNYPDIFTKLKDVSQNRELRNWYEEGIINEQEWKKFWVDQYGLITEVTVSEIVSELNAQIVPGNEKRSNESSGLLVETIAEILKENPGKSIGGRALDRLRKAILRPDEYASLSDQLRKRPHSCLMCGHEFNGVYEIASVGASGLRCSRCSTPTEIACSINGCHHPAPINKAIQKALKFREKCDKHNRGAEVPANVQEAAERAAAELEVGLADPEIFHRDMRAQWNFVQLDPPPGPRQARPWRELQEEARHMGRNLQPQILPDNPFAEPEE